MIVGNVSLEHIMDEIEIKSLLIRERYYRDTNQWEKLRDSYHPEASKTMIDISWFTGDIDGFVAGSKAMAKGGTGAAHTICPVEIHIRGRKAVAESTGNIQIRTNYQGVEYDLVSWTRFISRLSKTANGWRLLTLEAIYDRDTLTPVVPTPSAEIKHELLGPRASYKCLSLILSQRGFNINQDLPGTDRPASVAKLMQSAFDWLG